MAEYEVFVDTDPDPRDLVRQLRVALGWADVALPISPKQAWEEAIATVRLLAGTREIDQLHIDGAESDG